MENITTRNYLRSGVEKAKPSDAGAINEISRQAWQSSYPSEAHGITVDDIKLRTDGPDGTLIERKARQWQAIIESSGDNHEVFVAHSDNKVVGFVSPRVEHDGQRRIAAIYVSPDAQGNGYGAALLLSALDWHGNESDVSLNVVAYNQQAIDFYERFGFIQTDRKVEDRLSQINGFKELPLIEMILSKPAHEE